MYLDSNKADNLAIGAEHQMVDDNKLLIIFNHRFLKFHRLLILTNYCPVVGKDGLVILFLILIFKRLYDYWASKLKNLDIVTN